MSTDRPHVRVDPAMKSGRPCVSGVRIPVEAVGEHVWAGEDVAEVASDYGLRREDVLVACWWLGRHSPRREWRKRWGAWAESVDGALWKQDYDVEDPPGRPGEH